MQSGAGNTVHPDKAVFFLNYGTELKRHLEKAERENGFIYHQKIPEKLPELNLKATHGLAEPESYSLPEKRSSYSQIKLDLKKLIIALDGDQSFLLLLTFQKFQNERNGRKSARITEKKYPISKNPMSKSQKIMPVLLCER